MLYTGRTVARPSVFIDLLARDYFISVGKQLMVHPSCDTDWRRGMTSALLSQSL